MKVENKYYKCKNCSHIFLKERYDNCPKCSTPIAINENFEEQEELFNLCD